MNPLKTKAYFLAAGLGVVALSYLTINRATGSALASTGGAGGDSSFSSGDSGGSIGIPGKKPPPGSGGSGGTDPGTAPGSGSDGVFNIGGGDSGGGGGGWGDDPTFGQERPPDSGGPSGGGGSGDNPTFGPRYNPPPPPIPLTHPVGGGSSLGGGPVSD